MQPVAKPFLARSAAIGCVVTLAIFLLSYTGRETTTADGRAQVARLSVFVSGDWDRVTRKPVTSQPHGGSNIRGPSIRLGFEFSFPEDRVLASPALHVGAEKVSGGYLWARDGADHEGEDLDDALPLAAGTSVLYEATIQPECGEPAHHPTILLSVSTTVADGRSVVEQFEPENPEAFAAAITLACGTDLAFQAGGGSIGDDGQARVAFLVNNPGTSSVTVEIPALTRNGASWEAASVTVPSESYSMIELVGAGVSCGAHQGVPWTTYRILVNTRHTEAPLIEAWDC